MQARYHFDFFSARVPIFTRLLSPLQGAPKVRMLEVGSFEGLSASWFLREILTGQGATLTCVDPWVPYPELTAEELQVMQYDAEANFDHNTKLACEASGARLYKHKGCAEDILPGLFPESFDAIYLDGSHQTHHVLADLVFAWRLLKDQGLLFCDDYQHVRFLDPLWTPKLAIDSFLTCYRHHYHLLHKQYMVVLRKIKAPEYFLHSPQQYML